MAKDRFNTRESYDPTYKFNTYVNTVSKERNINSQQVTLMKAMYKRETLSKWEKQFIKGCLKLNILSKRQKDILNKIYNKVKHELDI